jgi:hypothetical protein
MIICFRPSNIIIGTAATNTSEELDAFVFRVEILKNSYGFTQRHNTDDHDLNLQLVYNLSN